MRAFIPRGAQMKYILILSVALLLLTVKQAQAKSYTVKRGDTLASIARSYYGEPVFGPKGSINKIYKMNPWSKAAGSALEPGQKLLLEDKTAPEAVTEIEAPPSPKVKTEEPHEQKAEVLPAPVLKTVEPAEPVAILPPAAEIKTELHEVPHSNQAAHHHELPESQPESQSESQSESHNYFSIIPSYSLINQKAIDVASGNGYSLGANSYGVELGWDHWWNESFSTLLTYSIVQENSSATNDVTGEKVLNPMILSQVELALLNKITRRLRMGLGAGYSDHLFLENVADRPVNPSIYKVAFWNPFFTGELTTYESESFEFLFNFKIGALPALDRQIKNQR